MHEVTWDDLAKLSDRQRRASERMIEAFKSIIQKSMELKIYGLKKPYQKKTT